jgi:predicted TIM-barrel fold metal-dependent hydrolase
MIIDFHTHVVPPWVKERREEIAASDECFSLLYSDPRSRLATSEEIIANMDECSIDISVILNLSWQSHDMCVKTNDYILESIARYPKRLIGFCSLYNPDIDQAIGEIERCARNGARGIGEMRPDLPGFDLGDTALLRDMVGKLVEHDMALLLHASEPVGHQYGGKGLATPAMVYPFIKSFQELNIICAHWGGGLPFYALMPEVAGELKNVYFDSAATPFLYEADIFRIVRDLVGSEKILFGSDYPLLSPKRILDQVESAGLNKDEKAGIEGNNAKLLLSIV